MPNHDLTLLEGYPDELVAQVQTLINENKLDNYIKERHPQSHNITTSKALFNYVHEMRKKFMKRSSTIHKVLFDDKIDTTHRALGLHTFVSQVQGKNLISKNEIKIAAIFKKAPADFLQMIVVHELAHLKEKDHNKHFYRLCNHMMEDYDQMELDLRIYLIKLTLDQRDSSFPS